MTLRRTLILIGIVQLVLGGIFLIPGLFQQMIGLDETPEWVNWIFTMFGARALGFAYGMFVAAREPARHLAWIWVMIGVQAIDWIGTIAYLVSGAVKLAQVNSAAFLPIVFIAILVRHSPRPGQSQHTAAAQAL